MELVLTGLNWKISVIYLDDIIIYGGSFYDSLNRLNKVWQRIREGNLSIQSVTWWVPFLGNYV